ncbi:uncharacterized protein LOC111003710 isoform X1 [Pieris rapae]|uniref:uncharacterized protein LOC111003710 isoform X1 n=1 Tax=Pieris rapae TaxID=64459 RepID=UPI001E27CF2D|nr:uncharacterized protein LOC111003710 isoform X1 [Pieris rapae]XP_045485581.1 uncharacterized protein LOC111003710 isoform X1 [Pieris rapae]
MAHSRGNLVTALILFTLQIATPAKNNARPVYEVIHEQARMDDIRLSSAPDTLPYGNPLAGNSAQNARLHASNQQAMFNAERIRQHKAQLQRLTQGPPLIDSYMKAYHESQESHQQALEEQQATVQDVETTTPAISHQIRNRPIQNRQRTRNRDRSGIQKQEFKSRTISVEPEKRTRGVNERSRNHRSYGSVEYEQYLQSKLPLAYLTATGSDQGVTIKSNGNAGITKEQNKESSNLYTTAISSSSKYLPKAYHPVKEINALESILRKEPSDQLTEFQTLLNADQTLDNFQYPLKDPSEHQNPKSYNGAFEQIPSTYASAYSVRDHTPITEEIDDIENPKPYQNTFVIPQVTTVAPLSMVTNSYYKIEVASQTIGSAINPNKINEGLTLNQEDSIHENIGESYINYPDGIQHLAEDGTGVSAYGDENVSNKLRFKRSELDTEPFLLPVTNETITETQTPSNTTDNPVAESLRRPFHKKRNDFDIFLTPDFQIGEASDYDYDETPKRRPTPKYESFYGDDDYYEDFDNEHDEPRPISLAEQPLQNTHVSYPSGIKGSFSHRYGEFRRPSPGPVYGLPPTTSYGVPSLYEPQTFNPSPYISPVNSLVPNVLEPVYMLTQSQLRQLIGQPNLNIEHLDVYQVSKDKKKMHYRRKFRKRYPYKQRNVRNKLHKLHKLKLV